MSTTFLEPGGDATFDNKLWSASSGILVTDFVHGGHIKSGKLGPSNTQGFAKDSILADSGTRFSVYIYLVTLPTITSHLIGVLTSGGSSFVFKISITAAGVLKILQGDSAVQIGTDGATLSTGQWYRISLAYTLTSTSVNRFELFVDGISSISITNATLQRTGSSYFLLQNNQNDVTLDFRVSDIYIDDSSSLVDTGNIWVTAKRPNANGTTNNFNVQIGSGGSGYGTGHSPQVNERPLDTSDGWSVVAAGATTEEYNIENQSTGDINITGSTIKDYIGWVYAKSLLSETANIMLNGSTSNISLTSASGMFTKAAGSTTYPAGTGTDIGIVTDATATTVSLYECGIMIAYIPKPNVGSMLLMFK